MTIKNLFLGLVVVAVIAIIGLFTPIGSVATKSLGQITDTFTGDYFNATAGFQIAGTAVVSSSNYNVSGVTVYPNSASFTTGTTTPCIIASPSATSTLTFASVQVTTATGTDVLIDIAKAGAGDSRDHATTTLLASTFEWDANAKGDASNGNANITASSSPLAGNSYVFAPNTNLVVKMASKNLEADGTAKTTFSLSGTCKANFLVN